MYGWLTCDNKLESSTLIISKILFIDCVYLTFECVFITTIGIKLEKWPICSLFQLLLLNLIMS